MTRWAPRHHTVTFNIGGDTFSDREAWLHAYDDDDSWQPPLPPMPVKPVKLHEAAASTGQDAEE